MSVDLPGTVVANDCQDFARHQFEIAVFHGSDAAVAFGKPTSRKNRFGHYALAFLMYWSTVTATIMRMPISK